MTGKEALLEAHAVSNDMFNTFLANVGEEDSMVRGADGMNHIRWQVGHLAATNHLLATILGDTPPLPDNADYDKLFGYGSEVLDDPAVYPSLADLKALHQTTYEQARTNLAAFDDTRLQEETQISPQWTETFGRAVLFLCHHTTYHAGQISAIRAKILKKDRVVG
jgi:hypothetical protein